MSSLFLQLFVPVRFFVGPDDNVVGMPDMDEGDRTHYMDVAPIPRDEEA